MESKEYITYSRRAKAVERPQQSLVRNNQFHGYRSTKRWVEETGQQQCRGGSIEKAEQLQPQQQQQQQYYYQNEGAARGFDVTPCRTTTRKKEGRGVHFKQENDQTSSRLETKFGNQASPLQPAIVRKDSFPESQAAALSPISLNVAAGGRQMANSFIPTKNSPAAAATTLPKGGVPQTLGHISVISPDGRVQTFPSGRDEEGRQVVWCNAAFEAEADDDLRSQDSAHSNRYSPASCSKNVESDVCGPLLVVPSMNEKPRDQQQARGGASGISHLVNANLSAVFCSEAAITSAASVVPRSSGPPTVMATSPEQDFKVPQIAQLELDSAAGEWYTPMGSEASSHTSRRFAHGHERPTEHSKTRRALAATPSFKTAVPPQTMPSHPNRHVPGSRGGRSVSCSNSRKYPKYFTEIQHPSNCESAAGKTNSNSRACLSHDNGPRNATKRVGGGGASILAGRVEPVALNNPPRSSTTPKIQRFQEDSLVEADLEADIEHEIEQEISMEILQLSERLAALHAKHETRRVGGGNGGGCPERSKTGGMSCPQTPLRNAPSPCGSDSAKGKRKGRVVAAKFLQYTTDGSNVKRDKSVTRTERPSSADRPVLFSDGPFLGRPNPPRRSLGTPSRLLTKGKQQNGQQQQGSCGSPCHMVKERIMEEQPRGIGASKVTIDEYMRSRAMIESGGKRVVRVFPQKNFGDEERKEWNDDRGIVGQQSNKKKENHHHQHPAPTLCTGSPAAAHQHPHFYPEFERKVDWVKTLRTDPIPAAHPCSAATLSSSSPAPAPALDERFLKQKSERQDVNAWLRENISIAGNCEIPNFSPHVPGPTGIIYDGASLQAGGGGGVQVDSRKTRGAAEEEDSTNSRSTRPSNGWTSSLSNARPATPNRCTPNRATTPSRGNARTVPSRYGTPVKAGPAAARDPGNNNKSTDPKPTIMENFSRPKTWYGQTTPSKSFNNKDAKALLPLRKASPTTRKGYPGELPAVTNNSGSKDRRGVVLNSSNNAEASAKGERKITIVGGSEYEKFVQEGVAIDKRVPAARKNVDGGGFKAQEEPGVRPKTPSSSVKQQRGTCELAPPAPDPMAAKKIFIRCSDLIKDKHSMLVKGKQRRLAGQGGFPSEAQDSDDSGFGRRSSNNTRTDLSELDADKSRSDEASIIEESTYIQDLRLSQRRAVEDGGGKTTSCKSFCSSERSSLLPDFDIVYDHESGHPKGSAYRPEDYTLEMMLQYVDTLKCEREALPRIRAVNDVAATGSPRDSGCIKRRKEGEKRNRFYFNAGGEAKKVQVPKCANSTEKDGLSPNEIEGLDLESFWCLVGELEGPILI